MAIIWKQFLLVDLFLLSNMGCDATKMNEQMKFRMSEIRSSPVKEVSPTHRNFMLFHISKQLFVNLVCIAC